MIKIVALNDSDQDEDQEETITQVTKEAQETIAVSEYLRALSLKQNGNVEFALSLFEGLLETQVLSEVPDDDKDNKLFSVKYNCLRNIGLIHEERGEFQLALKFLVDAVELDATDVFTQCKIGKLALKQRNLRIARDAFEKCLVRNPNHWSSKDGLLQTLCLMEDVDQAYGFALKCYNDDKHYERAIHVLVEIRERFKGSIPYYDGLFGMKFEPPEECKIVFDPANSVFPPYKEIEFTKDNEAVLTDDFKIVELNWITFGNLILKVYHHLEDGNYSLISCFKWDDWVGKPEELPPPELQTETANTENLNGEVDDLNTDENEMLNDGQSPDKEAENAETIESEGQEQDSKQKASNRRRCSDLDFLKEWGWHKNRRSSRKKAKEEDPHETVDTTINGFLRRILPNYFIEHFDTHHSPFAQEKKEDAKLNESSDHHDLHKADAEDEQKFNELTQESFQEFISTFEERQFDLVIPMFQWLRFISIYWDQTVIPPEILQLFKKIYKIYEGFVDYHSMHQLPIMEFEATFRMAMFYFELTFDDIEDTKTEISDSYIIKKDFLQCNIGFIDDDINCTKMLIRLVWLSYCLHLYNNNYKDALGFLYKIEEIFEVPKYQDIAVELKNNKHNKTIDSKTVKDLIVKIERKINLASVKKLYDTQNYSELVEILRESITYSTEPKCNIDNLTLKIQTQLEIFLECLWNLNRLEECLIYAEKTLRYAVENFLSAPTEYRLEEWASLVNYALVYIEAIIKEEGSEVLMCLGKYISRLIQSLAQIVTHQLDSPVEKNNPQSIHLINLTIPWTVLYNLILKEDDASNAVSKKNSILSPDKTADEDFETIPNSLLVFFTAHDFIGRKQWCMKDNGKLLIFLLDVLAPIYRTPLLEPFRDIIAEHLEQTTFCLYGYPAKKARSRHIEDHDAKNIDLTWERAIQLFDLYRPDTLPEFDSFKLASISSEMEQLLQRILPLIPKCLDIQPFIGEIKKFISGTTTTLPKEVNILPSRIASIYYLLADFYFKNQETGKAIKFYIYDLTIKPDRFDSWASISLCKQSKLEMKLNSYNLITVKEFLESADQTINCFNESLKLKKTITIMTEFASFSYHLHSFCSRNLKQSSETLSMENFAAMEERKERFLNISLKCFTQVCEAVSDPTHELNNSKTHDDAEDNNEEKWYYYFMLGKIAEKKKDPPNVFLKHYLTSAKYLYEDNATYPIKINHTNPTHLAIEALEVFYRISASILKYLEQHTKINKSTAKYFMRVLKEMSTSPFAYNRAKINEDNINALKRKMNTTATDETPSKQLKASKSPESVQKPFDIEQPKDEQTAECVSEKMEINENASDDVNAKQPESDKMEIDRMPDAPIQPIIKTIIAESEVSSRRGSQESAITSTTTSNTHTSSSSSDSSSDSSDSDSSSSDDETDGADKENVFADQDQINNIYKMCIKNLEECITRFPEHYKSIYRLIHHFLNVGETLNRCRQLLLGSDYKTTLGNSIGGLFSERKNNNFFNGIWRVPCQEIDRPGNFTTHLCKCVITLMEVLKRTNDYETLMDLALQLQRNPEADKKYLNDADKKELFHQAVTCCIQAFKNKLREILSDASEDKNRSLLSLMLEIFKSHRKTQKNFQNKDQSLFSGVLVEVYKEYIKDKMTLPDSANLTDLAFKMCQQEINYRKNLEKGIVTPNPNPIMPQQPTQASSPIRIEVKSVSDINKSILNTSAGSKPGTPNPQGHTNAPQSSAPKQSGSTSSGSSARTKPRSSGSTKMSDNSLLGNAAAMNQMLMSLYSDPTLLSQMFQSNAANSSLLNEYYKLMGLAPSGTSSLLSGLSPQQMALLGDPMTMASALSSFGIPPQTSTAATSTSTKSVPAASKASGNFESKYLDSLKSLAGSSNTNTLSGLQQNLMSNSLSITTTSMTSTTSSLLKNTSSSMASLTKSQTSRKPTSGTSRDSQKPKSSISVSMSKTNQQQDMAKMKNLYAATSFFTDLPKSLSITPTLASGSGKSTNRVSDKGKNISKEKSSASSSAASKFASILDNFNMSSSVSITPEGYPATNVSGMLSSYTDFLKNYPLQQQALAMGQGGANNRKSAPATVVSSSSRSQKSKISMAPVQSLKKSMSSVPSQQTTKPIQMASYDFGKNIASSFSGLPMSSPTLSSSPYSQQHTPPLTPSPSLQVSPHKTLQQKLAERKQQNQKKPSNSSSGKKPDDDVIILE